jgi:WD40 repeat protein
MPERINDFAFSPDGTMIAGTCRNTGIVRIWNIQTGNIIKNITIQKLY